MDKEIQIQWRQEPEDKNYPAAESYLGLIYDNEAVRSIVNRLKNAPVVQFKAKISSGLPGCHYWGSAIYTSRRT